MAAQVAAIKVLVVDDEEAVVDVLRSLIGSDPSLELVGAAHDAERGIELAVETQPDVILMDVRMPGGGGVRAVREITRRCPPAKVVALSAHEDGDTRIRMIGAGARDYIPKSESTDAILDAIHRSAATEGATPAGRKSRPRLATSQERRAEQRLRVDRVLRSGSVTCTFQPIVDLDTGDVVGVEAQPQIAMLPRRSFDAWAADAEAVGLLERLDIAAFRSAVKVLRTLPEELFLELEVSPTTARDARLHRAIRDRVAPRLVLAISELGYPDPGLATTFAPLRERGVRLCLADVGAGIGGLGHLVSLWPEYVRLDRTLSEDVELDLARHAVVAAVVAWAGEGGSAVIADGVTSTAQLEELGRLGVRYAQGERLGSARHLADLVTSGLEPWTVEPERRGGAP
jgi:EAL domain-containing protein (putative c-di-GMP-specific phosphodiesterase class I)/CheY-like chemotaxis protein